MWEASLPTVDFCGTYYPVTTSMSAAAVWMCVCLLLLDSTGELRVPRSVADRHRQSYAQRWWVSVHSTHFLQLTKRFHLSTVQDGQSVSLAVRCLGVPDFWKICWHAWLMKMSSLRVTGRWEMLAWRLMLHHVWDVISWLVQEKPKKWFVCRAGERSN